MGRLTTVKSRVQMAKPRPMATVEVESWRSGKSSTQRGYGYKWQQARARYLAKHPLCCTCRDEGKVVVATDVDHIVPHRGDQALFWSEDNWQSLCHSHHSVKTQEETRNDTSL